jgi:Spy/CpxP family protein refolding chaperone
MQQSPEHGPSVERELKKLTHSLALTTAQQAQVKAILIDQHQQIEALFNQSRASTQNGKTSADAASGDDQSPSMEAMEQSRAAVKAIREDASAKIAALLTDDQKTRFAALENARQKAEAKQDELPPPTPDGGGGGAPGGGPPGI